MCTREHQATLTGYGPVQIIHFSGCQFFPSYNNRIILVFFYLVGHLVELCEEN